MMKIKAAIQMQKEGPLTVREAQLEDPRDDEVLVKLVACGICHTDLLMRKETAHYPFLPGHEGAGIVEKTGKNVHGISEGDHVVLSYTSCGHCAACLRGEPYRCEGLIDPFYYGFREDGTSSVSVDGKTVPTLIGQGSFATCAVVHKSAVVKVPETADLKILAPLGCGIQTGAGAVRNVLKPEKGSTILICGIGAVGFGAVTAAKIAGCGTIIALDKNSQRLELAREFGATHTVDMSVCCDPEKEIRSISDKILYGYDSTGRQEILDLMERVFADGAKACGAAGGTMDHTDWQIADEGHSVAQEMIPQMIRWHEEGLFPFEKFIRFYPFEEAERACCDLEAGYVIKPVLCF